jgi:hypothetical protein
MLKKLRIKARDAVNDIRCGINDSEMMQKYGLSAKGLHKLFMKLLEVKAISQSELDKRCAAYQDTIMIQHLDSRNMADDLRTGMSDSEMMKKYALSSGGLQRAFQRMMDANIITVEDLHGPSQSPYDSVFVEDVREVPRYHLAVEVVIYELKNPGIRGSLLNLGEKGIAIRSIQARIGEAKTFIIPAVKFVQIDPVRFDAECKWAREDPIIGEWHTGFAIMHISSKCWDDFETLVRSASLIG